ncbi:type I restriction endonuclease subunit R, partial [Myxococcota bacterium]|nr:type I restriction endonuclease subunit R [Myxococcota bacterium]
EKAAIENFKDSEHELKILIVCNKLLTGFDAPVEQAMYLDSPLSDHNLLQAIARTNRRYGPTKTRGSIVDYIGVSKNLADALSAYHNEDIEGAMTDEDALYSDLQTAHREVMALLGDAARTGEPKVDAQAAVYALQAEDSWFEFLGKANTFLVAYGALSPDPRVFEFKVDLKYVGSIIPYGKQHFEAATEEVDWRQYSEKIREILDQHLKVTGLSTIIKLRSLSDPSFWEDFKAEGEDLQTAAVRKLVEMKKETTERTEKNPARYGKFSERVQKLIESFQQGLIDAAEVMSEAKEIAEEVQKEDSAFVTSGLSERAYDLFKILELFLEGEQPEMVGEAKVPYNAGGQSEALSPLHEAAEEIDTLYSSHETASAYWQEKPESRKKLTQLVRRIVHPLGIPDWQSLRVTIDDFAVRHYAKP